MVVVLVMVIIVVIVKSSRAHKIISSHAQQLTFLLNNDRGAIKLQGAAINNACEANNQHLATSTIVYLLINQF